MIKFKSSAQLLEETYATSKDYNKLVGLIKNEDTLILCFYDSKYDETRSIRKFDTLHSLNQLGSLYLAFNEHEDENIFIEFCETVNLTFIDPHKAYSKDDVQTALHKVELEDSKNYSKIWEKLELNL